MLEKMVPEIMVPEKNGLRGKNPGKDGSKKMVPEICEIYAETNYLRKQPKSREMKDLLEQGNLYLQVSIKKMTMFLKQKSFSA